MSEQIILRLVLIIMVLVAVVGAVEYAAPWSLVVILSFGAVASRYGYVRGRDLPPPSSSRDTPEKGER